MKLTTICLFAALAFAVPAAAGDLDHLYVPYGYSFPSLHSGEYVLTGNYRQSKRSATTYYENESDTAWSEGDPGRQLNASAAIGLLDNLLLHASVSYSFKNVSTSRSTFGSYSRNEDDDSWTPTVEAIFRPLPRLQLSAGYSRQSATHSSYSESGGNIVFISQGTATTTYDTFAVSVTWSGRL